MSDYFTSFAQATAGAHQAKLASRSTISMAAQKPTGCTRRPTYRIEHHGNAAEHGPVHISSQTMHSQDLVWPCISSHYDIRAGRTFARDELKSRRSYVTASVCSAPHPQEFFRRYNRPSLYLQVNAWMTSDGGFHWNTHGSSNWVDLSQDMWREAAKE